MVFTHLGLYLAEVYVVLAHLFECRRRAEYSCGVMSRQVVTNSST